MITIRTSLPFGRLSPEPTVPDALSGIGRIAQASTKEGIVVGYGYRSVDCTGRASFTLAEGSECATGAAALVGRNNGKTFEVETVLGIGGGGAPVGGGDTIPSPFEEAACTEVVVDGETHGVWCLATGEYLGVWEDLKPDVPWVSTKEGLEEQGAGWFFRGGEMGKFFPAVWHPYGGIRALDSPYGSQAQVASMPTVRAATPWRTWAAGPDGLILGSAVEVDYSLVLGEGTLPADDPETPADESDPALFLAAGCGFDCIAAWDTGSPLNTTGDEPPAVDSLLMLVPMDDGSPTPPYPESRHAWFSGSDGSAWTHVVGDRTLSKYAFPPGFQWPPAPVDAMVYPDMPTAPDVVDSLTGTTKKTYADIGSLHHYVTFVGPSGESHLSDASVMTSRDVDDNRDFDLTLPLGPPGTTARRVYRQSWDISFGYMPALPGLVDEVSDNETTTFHDDVAHVDLGGPPSAGPDYVAGGITSDIYRYAATCIIDGEETRLSPLSEPMNTGSDYYITGVIDVEVSPGPAGTTSRLVYRVRDHLTATNLAAVDYVPGPADMHLIGEAEGNDTVTLHDRTGEGDWGGPPTTPTLTSADTVTLSEDGWAENSWIDRIETL